MRALLVNHNFPPEVNAGATRIYDQAYFWTKEGGDVEVIAPNPNYPEGVIYDGYDNRFMQEGMDGFDVTRVPIYIAENKGTLMRTLGFVSFMMSAWWHSSRLKAPPDIVIGSSPQFFGAVAGYLISRRYKVPYVFEVRDLWPDSVVAVGAMERNMVIRMFERLEKWLYQKADHIIVATDSFKKIISEKGIDPAKISPAKNGTDVDKFRLPLDPKKLEETRAEINPKGRFVVSYLGTIGMAHRADILLEAARKCKNENILFLVGGGGAEWEGLRQKAEKLQLPNFKLIPKQPKEMMPYLLEITDVSVVHLKDLPVFRSVIPSKMFESMAMKKPIILGVRGEAKEILIESNSGIPVYPERVDELVDAAETLATDMEKYREMAESGFQYVCEKMDRKNIAKEYWETLTRVVEEAGR